jgi:hypothetical protein
MFLLLKEQQLPFLHASFSQSPLAFFFQQQLQLQLPVVPL